jgi:hypothetical protein
MTNYYKHDFKLSMCQKRRLIGAIKNQEPIVLRLSKDSFTDGNISLPLTSKDSNNVVTNKPFSYHLNKSKLKFIKLDEATGGFLPILLPILAGLAGLGTASASIANAVINKKSADAKLEEERRHNQALEDSIKGDGVYLTPESPPWKNYGMSVDVKDFINNSKLDPTGKRVLRSVIKNLSSHFMIKRQGKGIYLENRE